MQYLLVNFLQSDQQPNIIFEQMQFGARTLKFFLMVLAFTLNDIVAMMKMFESESNYKPNQMLKRKCFSFNFLWIIIWQMW